MNVAKIFCLLFIASVADAETVVLPAGTQLDIELLQSVTPKYTPVGTAVYFRVTDEVGVNGVTAIRLNSLVLGHMQDGRVAGMVGRSGQMTVVLQQVDAVDGTHVPLQLDLSMAGRSRAWAVVGWTAFWGIPGLITHGRNPYAERGTRFDATVLVDTKLELPGPPLPETSSLGSAPRVLQIDDLKYVRSSHLSIHKLSYSIDRNEDLEDVRFTFAEDIAKLTLVTVNGQRVPETVAPIELTGRDAVFHTWSVLQYCNTGGMELGFLGQTADGQPFTATYKLNVKVKRSGGMVREPVEKGTKEWEDRQAYHPKQSP